MLVLCNDMLSVDLLAYQHYTSKKRATSPTCTMHARVPAAAAPNLELMMLKLFGVHVLSTLKHRPQQEMRLAYINLFVRITSRLVPVRGSCRKKSQSSHKTLIRVSRYAYRMKLSQSSAYLVISPCTSYGNNFRRETRRRGLHISARDFVRKCAMADAAVAGRRADSRLT